MKRLFLSLFILLALHLSAFEVLAQQRQRLAIPPQSFSLPKNGSSYDAKAYCLDRHLVISDPTDFTEVLAGDARVVTVGNRPPMTLKQAIDQGLITVKGAGVRNSRSYSNIDGTQLKFTSETDEPVTINFRQTLAMGEQGSSPVNPLLLAPVRATQTDEAFRKIQDAVWFSGIDESRLEAMGFYGSGTIVRTPVATRNAVRAFQRKLNLPQQNGMLDEPTRAALERVELQEIAAFERQGLIVDRTDTEVPSVVDNIRAFERFLGLPESGKLTDELRAKLDKFAIDYGALVRQAMRVDALRALPAEQSIMRDNPDLITFQRASLIISGQRFSLTALLFKRGNEVEYWLMQNGGLYSREVGNEAIVGFDRISARFAAVDLGTGRFGVRSGIYKPGGRVSLQLGSKRISLTEAEMEKFISGELKNPEIDAAIEKMAGSSTSKPTLIVYRSPFEQGRGVGGAGGGSPLAQFGYRQHDPLKLYLALKRKDRFNVLLASDLDRAVSNLVRQPKLSAGSQIGLYVDDQFKYSTDIIEPIRRDLERAEIKVLKAGDDPSSQTRIFLFAGHRDEAYQQLVLRLADEGRFRGGIVALAVCGSGNCDAQFNSLLIGRSGARAVIFYNQEIKAQAVQDVILKFTELLMNEGAPNGNYHELWQRSVSEVERTATPNQRNEIRKLRDIIIQLSAVRRESLWQNAE
ncbi:MAG TPA: peptidoglycan-binding domain-containing protein [Pyrinomonadaceae bacterium]|jgi:hypothetical protein